MARRYSNADPTANTAAKNVDRERKRTRKPQRQGRRIVAEFPDIFDDLLMHEAKDLALKAHHLAGNDVWAITREHLEQARKAVRGA